MTLAANTPLSLSIDTCGPSLLLVLGCDQGVVAFDYQEMPTGQAEAILPALDRLLAKAGHPAKAPFSAIGVTIGPGSFTGLRVGLAAAKARALVDGCSVRPVNRLQMLARCSQLSADKPSAVGVAIDARRGEHFVQSFAADLTPLGEAATIENEAVSAWREAQTREHGEIIFVPGAAAFSETVLASALLEQSLKAPAQSHAALRPLYVRPPDAKRPKETRFTLVQ